MEREEGVELPNERKDEQSQFPQHLPAFHATIESQTTKISTTAEVGTLVEQNLEECEVLASNLEQQPGLFG